jgi:hypothetical protein
VKVAGLDALQAFLSPRAQAPGGLSKAAPAGDEEEEPEEEEPEEEDEEDEVEEESAGDEETEDEEEENGMEGANKSRAILTEGDFQKSLDRLEAEAASGSQESRKGELLAKAQGGAELDPAEREELYAILGGGDPATKSFGAEVTEGLNTNETLQKAYDVSDFLAEHNLELTKSLDALSSRIEADGSRQHEFNLILAKAMVDTGKLIKAMSERLGVIAAQPARQPKSAGAQPLQKSMMGGTQPAAGEELTKGQIANALDDLMEKSVNAGNQGISDKGMDIAVETAKFEMTNKLSPQMFAEVQEHIGSSRG